MQKHFLKFGKVFTNVACSPLILISNNSELASKYLPNDVDQSKTTLEIPKINIDLSQRIVLKKEKKFQEKIDEFPKTNIERAELEAFASAVKGTNDYPLGSAEALHGVAVLEGILQSVKTCQPVDL